MSLTGVSDRAGLQTLNRSYGSSSDFAFPALTQSSWGWHTPDPRKLDPSMPAVWREDGSLNITYEDYPIASLDERPGHGNRTVPYLLNCQAHNDPRLCAWWYNFPVRAAPMFPPPSSSHSPTFQRTLPAQNFCTLGGHALPAQNF